MPINQSDIEKVANLAHLELAEEELKTFGPQITEIINYVEQLNELDTTNVEPALGGLTPEGEKTESSRADELAGSLGSLPRPEGAITKILTFRKYRFLKGRPHNEKSATSVTSRYKFAKSDQAKSVC